MTSILAMLTSFRCVGPAVCRPYLHHLIATTLLILGLGAGSASLASSDMTFPSQRIRIIDAYAPGGPTDTIARLIANYLSPVLGVPVIVENRAGASGTIAASEVARSKDGHTLLNGVTSTIAVIPALRKLSYDTEKDLVPVVQTTTFRSVLVVPARSPYDTLEQLIAAARQRPDKLNYASAGVATANHLGAELFQSLTKTRLTHVPYKGAGPAVTALMAGEVDLMFGTLPATMGQIRSGHLKPLAVIAPERNSQLPDVPTIAEAGLPSFDLVSWLGFLAPLSMPRDHIVRINHAVIEALKNPELQVQLQARLAEITTGSPEDFSKIIRQDTQHWANVIREADIRDN